MARRGHLNGGPPPLECGVVVGVVRLEGVVVALFHERRREGERRDRREEGGSEEVGGEEEGDGGREADVEVVVDDGDGVDRDDGVEDGVGGGGDEGEARPEGGDEVVRGDDEVEQRREGERADQDVDLVGLVLVEQAHVDDLVEDLEPDHRDELAGADAAREEDVGLSDGRRLRVRRAAGTSRQQMRKTW